jgi:D-alanyl-D-alanine carboxypeptidase
MTFDGEDVIISGRIQSIAFRCVAGLLLSCMTAQSSALKLIDSAALQTVVDATAKELLVPGAVVRLRTPQGEFVVTYGTTLLGAKSPPGADTYCRAASNTKTMTAAVILQLAQEGKLSVDDAVSKYVPGVPNGDHITIAELLEMRSGLYNYTDAPEISESMDYDPTKVWSPVEWLAIAFAHPPNAPPGTAYEYNNTNYLLLSLVAEKVDGRPLAQSMQDRLFGRLRLQHTVFPALAVNGSASVAMMGSPPYSPDVQAAARAGTLLPKDYTDLNGSFTEGAGAVHRQRSCHLDRGAGWRQRAQRRISAPLARQLAARGPE